MVLLTYELSNLLILGSIGLVFRPQEYSPFFFMVPARLSDARIRPIPILEGTTTSLLLSCSLLSQKVINLVMFIHLVLFVNLDMIMKLVINLLDYFTNYKKYLIYFLHIVSSHLSFLSHSPWFFSCLFISICPYHSHQ